jgi:hypothetical protein
MNAAREGSIEPPRLQDAKQEISDPGPCALLQSTNALTFWRLGGSLSSHSADSGCRKFQMRLPSPPAFAAGCRGKAHNQSAPEPHQVHTEFH